MDVSLVVGFFPVIGLEHRRCQGELLRINQCDYFTWVHFFVRDNAQNNISPANMATTAVLERLETLEPQQSIRIRRSLFVWTMEEVTPRATYFIAGPVTP